MKAGGCKKEFNVSLLIAPAQYMWGSIALTLLCWHLAHRPCNAYDELVRTEQCGYAWQAWSKCVDAKRGDGHNFTEECRDPTMNLQQCMEEHRDYYQVHPMPTCH